MICVLLVFFHFNPITDASGENILDATRLLAGFVNSALLTVIALLVMGEGLARTGVLEAGAQMFFRYGRGYTALATGVINIRQATRAIDRTIVMIIAAALALGSSLQATGGAEFLAFPFLGMHRPPWCCPRSS